MGETNGAKLFTGLGIAVVGNFTPRGSGVSYQQEVLFESFTSEGAACLAVTHQQNRYLRPLATVWGLIRHRNRYQVLCCRGFSFWNWINGIAAIATAKLLRKPVTMVYRGGGFPEFVARYPGMVLPWLRRVDRLIVPSGYLHREFEKPGSRRDCSGCATCARDTTRGWPSKCCSACSNDFPKPR